MNNPHGSEVQPNLAPRVPVEAGARGLKPENPAPVVPAPAPVQDGTPIPAGTEISLDPATLVENQPKSPASTAKISSGESSNRELLTKYLAAEPHTNQEFAKFTQGIYPGKGA